MKDAQLFLDAFVDACRILAKYNVKTNELIFIKSDRFDKDLLNKPWDGDQFFNSFVNSGLIYKEDLFFFYKMLDKEDLKKRFDSKQSGSLFSYRRIVDGEVVWSRLNTLIPRSYSEEEPTVLLFIRDMPDFEATTYEAFQLMGEMVYRVFKLNFTDRTFVNIRDNPQEGEERRLHKEDALFAEKLYVNQELVHPDDQTSFDKHINEQFITDYLSEGNPSYNFYYRRKVKGLYRWVRLKVIPASDYSETNKDVYFYISDVHKVMLKMLDIKAATTYANFFAEKKLHLTEGYYENLLETLSNFTQPYIDYYLIDLEKDIFINYKLNYNNYNKDIPSVGKYSQITQEYIKKNYSAEEQKAISVFSSSDKLREALKDKMTISNIYTYPTGIRVKNTYVKTESRNGIPIKVICTTTPVVEDKKLKVKTFGNFEVYHIDGRPFEFKRKQSKQLFAYLIDRHGYPVTSKDIVVDILEKDPSDLKAVKYVSTLVKRAMDNLEEEGYGNIIIKEQRTFRVNVDEIDCDYYHILNGEQLYWNQYHNEYMKEYSWAEETNADLIHMTEV